MSKIVLSLQLITILSITLIKMDKRSQTHSLWNATQLPYRPHGYRNNVPYYNNNSNDSISAIGNNSSVRYLNTKNNVLNVIVPVMSSINNMNEVYYKTMNANASNSVVYGSITPTTERYSTNYVWNLKEQPLNSHASKNTIQTVAGNNVLDVQTLSVDDRLDKTTDILNDPCKNGCDTDWTPIPGSPHHSDINQDGIQKYDVTTNSSVLIRLKSYMNQNDSLRFDIKNRRILNKIESHNETSQPIKTISIYDDVQMYPPYQTINYDEEINRPRDFISNVQKNRINLIGLKHGSSYNNETVSDEGRHLYPDRSYYYSDYDYHKWYYNDHDRYSEPHSWKWLKARYYCKKYCHCCKEHDHYDSHTKHGVLGNLIHFLKSFGFDSGYDFFYGRSAIDDYNPLMYVTNLYRRFDDYHDYDHDDQESDESFVHFDHDHGEPDHVVDCQDLCSCCRSEIVVKLKEKIRALKWKRIRAEKLRGLIGALQHLIPDDDDCGDDCYGDYDDYDTDRSLDDRYDPGGYDHYDEPGHIYDLDHAEEPHGYSPAHHHYSHEIDHHYFDCSICCRFCKKTTIKIVKERGKKRKHKHHRKRFHKKGLWRFIKRLLRNKLPGISFEEEEDDDEDNGDTHVRWSQSGNQCCNDMSGVKVLVVVVVVAVIIIQSFSSVNIMIVVIIPIIFFGVIMILIFLLLQAVVPIYFIPIIAIVLIVVAAPILSIIAILFLVLPVLLLPIFFPFVLTLNGTTPYLLPNITCTKPFDLPVNCSIGNATLYYQDEAVEDYESSTILLESADVTTVEYDADPTEGAVIGKERLESESFYSKVNSAIGSGFCLERIGCHMAIYTRLFGFYNGFILRILANLSGPINESKFGSYRDAYQIGSLNSTDHEKCATLYYCQQINSLMIKK